MSHRQTDSPEGSDDPFLPLSAKDANETFDQGSIDLKSLFCFEDSSGYATSAADSPQIFHDFNTDSPFSSTATPSENSATGYSSPTLSDPAYNSVPHTPFLPSTYPPTPILDTPHPYPLQLQQTPEFLLDPPRAYHTTNPRSKPSHSHHASSVLASSGNRTNPPNHRRSLSQSDAERIAATFRHNNSPSPSIRRAASSTPDGGPLGIPLLEPFYKGLKHGQGHKKRRSNPPTSVPSPTVLGDQNPSFARPYAMIGTPLMQPQSAAYVNPEAGEAKAANGMRIQLNGPRFGYMPHHEQISESAKVLEIGAMVVVAKDAGKRSVNEKGIETREEETDVWKLVGQMESQLKLQDVGDTEKGLRGCEMIREALADKECVVKKGGGGESGVQTDTAGESQDTGVTHNSENMTDVHEEDSDIDTDKFVSSDGQDLMSMLQNDLKSHGYGEQEE